MKRGASCAEGTAFAAAIEIAVDNAPAKRIQLFPLGRWKGRNGQGPYEIADRAAAAAIVAATEKHQGSIRLMLDYDHQAPFAAVPGVGGTAIASGWVEKLHTEDDGIWADVEWTATASQRLRDREYRYISPYFAHDKQGRVTRIINAALVNIPNFELAAVAAGLPLGETNMKDLGMIVAALGLAAAATVEEAVASINGLKAAKDQLASTASALGLAADVGGEEIVTAAASALAAKADPAKFVPIADLNAVTARLGVIEGERVDTAVASAITAGKLIPAQKEWATGYAKEKGLAAFASFISAQPTILQPGAEPGRDGIDLKSDVLTADERATASMLGLSEDDFLKTRKEMAA